MNKRYILSSCAVASVLMAAGAAAQVPADAEASQEGGASVGGETGAADTSDGEESRWVQDSIVVTASKRDQALIDAPLSVTALRGEDLELRGQTSLNDFIATVPGVSIRPTSNGFSNVQIRGISASAGDSTVGYYLDEVPFSLSGSTISPNMRSFDLERVEVLRGPQGTLYGQGSMGGVIKLITNSPDLRDYEVKLEAATGVKDGGESDYLGNIAVNLPVVKDKFAVRLVAGYQKTGGYLDNVTSGEDDVNDNTSANYRVKALYVPTDDLKISASAWIQRDDAHFSNGGFDDYTLIGGPGTDTLGVDSDAYNLTVNYALGFADLTSATSLMKFGYVADNYSLIDAGAYVTTINAVSDLDNEVFAQEVRLVSSADGPVKWSIGGLYTNTDLVGAADVGVETVVPSIMTIFTNVDAVGAIDSEAWAVFGEISTEWFGGCLEPLLGLRYFKDKRSGYSDSVTTTINDFAAEGVPDVSDVTPYYDEASGTFDDVSPRFNLAYHVSEDWLAYVNVAKGFRSGGGNDSTGVALANSLGVSGASYEPDTVWSYELGSKAEFQGGRLVLEGAIYYNDWQDIQLMPYDQTTGLSFVFNGGAAYSQGIDLGVVYTPVDGLTLQASGNINESKLSEIDPAIAAVLPYEEGNPLDFVPRYQLNASADYAWSIPGMSGLNGSLYGAYSFSSPQTRTTTDGAFEGDEISVINLRAGVEKEDWGIYLYADNLLNEDGRVNSFVDNTGTRLQPRVVGLKLRATLR